MQDKCATDKCQNWKCPKMMRYSHVRQWEAMGKETNDFPYRDMSTGCKDIIVKNS